MKGLATVQMLKEIEKGTGKRIYELFDLICGTSTGGMLAIALGIKLMTLEQCEEIYKNLGELMPHPIPRFHSDHLHIFIIVIISFLSVVHQANWSSLILCLRTTKLQVGEKNWINSTKVHPKVLELLFMAPK